MGRRDDDEDATNATDSLRARIVDLIVKKLSTKEAARARTLVGQRGNLADQLVEIGAEERHVLDACMHATGLVAAPREWLKKPARFDDELDLTPFRRLNAAPVARKSGSLCIAYADPEIAVRRDRLGLPPHKAYLALNGSLDRALALMPGDEATRNDPDDVTAPNAEMPKSVPENAFYQPAGTARVPYIDPRTVDVDPEISAPSILGLRRRTSGLQLTRASDVPKEAPPRRGGMNLDPVLPAAGSTGPSGDAIPEELIPRFSRGPAASPKKAGPTMRQIGIGAGVVVALVFIALAIATRKPSPPPAPPPPADVTPPATPPAPAPSTPVWMMPDEDPYSRRVREVPSGP